MTEAIEQRLAAAAEALREYEVSVDRCAQLQGRVEAMTVQLTELRAEHAEEQRDVQRLEGLSLTRVLASLGGSRDDALARERAEADAARYRVAEAEARLDAVRRERAAVQARLDELASAPERYAAVLEEKERHLAASGDPRGGRLLALAAERGRLRGEIHEINEALQAAEAAQKALSLFQPPSDVVRVGAGRQGAPGRTGIA